MRLKASQSLQQRRRQVFRMEGVRRDQPDGLAAAWRDPEESILRSGSYLASYMVRQCRKGPSNLNQLLATRSAMSRKEELCVAALVEAVDDAVDALVRKAERRTKLGVLVNWPMKNTSWWMEEERRVLDLLSIKYGLCGLVGRRHREERLAWWAVSDDEMLSRLLSASDMMVEALRGASLRNRESFESGTLLA